MFDDVDDVDDDGCVENVVDDNVDGGCVYIVDDVDDILMMVVLMDCC